MFSQVNRVWPLLKRGAGLYISRRKEALRDGRNIKKAKVRAYTMHLIFKYVLLLFSCSRFFK